MALPFARRCPLPAAASPLRSHPADDKFGDAFGFTYEEFSEVSIGANPNVRWKKGNGHGRWGESRSSTTAREAE